MEFFYIHIKKKGWLATANNRQGLVPFLLIIGLIISTILLILMGGTDICFLEGVIDSLSNENNTVNETTIPNGRKWEKVITYTLLVVLVCIFLFGVDVPPVTPPSSPSSSSSSGSDGDACSSFF